MTESVPEGYVLQTCESINATLLMPAGWCFWNTGSDQYFVAHKKIEFNRKSTFETGLTLSAIKNVNHRSSYSYTAGRIAREHVESPPPHAKFQPISDLEIVNQGQQSTFRRQYITEGGMVMGLHLAPRTYYLGGICIAGSDTAYLSTFEAPTNEWEIYEPVAQVMIEGIRIQ